MLNKTEPLKVLIESNDLVDVYINDYSAFNFLALTFDSSSKLIGDVIEFVKNSFDTRWLSAGDLVFLFLPYAYIHELELLNLDPGDNCYRWKCPPEYDY